MNVFDIIGPVMIGPSSSHTAGAVRIGRVARELFGSMPDRVVIGLHGSFARTYVGHGTDKAVIAGLLGMSPDDVRIRSALEIASSLGMDFRFANTQIRGAHPNTLLISMEGKDGRKHTLQGSSVGGGNIAVTRIDGMNVEFSGVYHTLVIFHQDTPGAVAAIANLLAENGINIANMKVYRFCKGGSAIMVIETDQPVKAELETLIGGLEHIQGASLIRPV